MLAPTLTDIHQAAERIRPYAHRTPVLTCASLDEQVGAQVFMKCENLQKVGAFKFRGACNAVFSLTDEEAARGVATHSSGNHAQALALAARLRGIPAYIVMPENAPAVKKAAVAGYGGQITFCEPTLEARESTLAQVVEETGATVVHPYNNYQRHRRAGDRRAGTARRNPRPGCGHRAGRRRRTVERHSHRRERDFARASA